MYKQTEWKDHVTQYPNRRRITENGDGTVDLEKAQGTVIQQGTPQSATNFNNQEDGIQDAHIAEEINIIRRRLKEKEVDDRLDEIEADIDDELTPEVGTVTLTNSQKYPFNNSQTTVSLAKRRQTLNYEVTYEITASNGLAGDIEISDKQLNGFKIAFNGSATSVTVKYRVKGGIIV